MLNLQVRKASTVQALQSLRHVRREDGPPLRVDQLMCWVEEPQAFPKLLDSPRGVMHLWIYPRLRYSLWRGRKEKPKEYNFYNWHWRLYRAHLDGSLSVLHAIDAIICQCCAVVLCLRHHALHFLCLSPFADHPGSNDE